MSRRRSDPSRRTVQILTPPSVPLGIPENTIRLPFGAAKTSPVDARDVAEVIAAVLEHPDAQVGKVIEIPEDRTMRDPGAFGDLSPARVIVSLANQCEECLDDRLTIALPAE